MFRLLRTTVQRQMRSPVGHLTLRNNHNARLHHRLKSAPPSVRISFFYDELLAHDNADVDTYNLRLRWCQDPNEFMYVANEEMPRHGYAANADTWMTFIVSFGLEQFKQIDPNLWTLPMHEACVRKLFIEGRVHEGQDHVHRLIGGDDTMPAPMVDECQGWVSENLRSSRYSRLRTSWMNSLKNTDPERCVAFFETLVRNNVVDVVQIRLRLLLCSGSAHMKQALNTLLANDEWEQGTVKGAFTTSMGNGRGDCSDDEWRQIMDVYTHQLWLEGNREEHALYVQWTEKQHASKDPQTMSKERTWQLKKLLKNKDLAGFKRLYALLKQNKVVDHHHTTVYRQWEQSTTGGERPSTEQPHINTTAKVEAREWVDRERGEKEEKEEKEGHKRANQTQPGGQTKYNQEGRH